MIRQSPVPVVSLFKESYMNIKSWFKQSVREGDMIPVHLGIAYGDPWRNEFVCYLIPFNWVIRIVKNIWMKLRFPKWEQFEKRYSDKLHHMRSEIFADAHRRGFIDGYVTHALDMHIPVRYEQSISDTILRIQCQFARGLRKEDIPPTS